RHALGLAAKAIAGLGCAAQVRVHHLHRHRSVQIRVDAAVHGGHAPVPDLFDDLVLPELADHLAYARRRRLEGRVHKPSKSRARRAGPGAEAELREASGYFKGTREAYLGVVADPAPVRAPEH